MVAAAVAAWWKQSVTGSFARCVPDLSSGRQLTPASERGASREAQAFRSKQCDFKGALLGQWLLLLSCQTNCQLPTFRHKPTVFHGRALSLVDSVGAPC